MDVVTISRRLGHASPVITLSTYAYLFHSGDERRRDHGNCTVPLANGMKTKSRILRCQSGANSRFATGTINQIVHLWKFEDDADRRAHWAAVFANKDFVEGFAPRRSSSSSQHPGDRIRSHVGRPLADSESTVFKQRTPPP